MAFNSGYLSTNHGIIKIIQIIIGFVISACLCATWLGGRSCFGEGRIGFASGLNFVVLIINIVIFVLCLLEVMQYKLERIYTIVCIVLFLVAAVLLVWMVVVDNYDRTKIIVATVLIVVQFILFVYDFKILNGEISN